MEEKSSKSEIDALLKGSREARDHLWIELYHLNTTPFWRVRTRRRRARRCLTAAAMHIRRLDLLVELLAAGERSDPSERPRNEPWRPKYSPEEIERWERLR